MSDLDFGASIGIIDAVPDSVSSDGGAADSSQAPPGVGSADASPSTTDGGEVAPPSEPIAPVQKYTFGGQEFPSQAAAELAFRKAQNRSRTRDGMFKAKEARIAELEAEIRAARAGAVAAPVTEPSRPSERSNAAEEFDEGLYRSLLEMDSSNGSNFAVGYLREHMQKQHTASLEAAMGAYHKELQEFVQPLVQQSEAQKQVQRGAAVVNGMMNYTLPSGKPAYPELSDPVATAKINLLIKELELPPEYAMSTRGLHMVIATYRDIAGREAEALGSLPTSTPGPSHLPVSDSGSDRTPSAPLRKSEVDEFKAAIRSAPIANAELGFGTE